MFKKEIKKACGATHKEVVMFSAASLPIVIALEYFSGT